MTDQEQIIAIAEWCGWRKEEYRDVYDSETQTYNSWIRWMGLSGEIRSEPPNYLSDLNAIHEACSGLKNIKPWMSSSDGNQPAEFIYNLMGILGIEGHRHQGMGYSTAEEIFRMTQATARQRSEALLRTIGKWKP